MPQAPTQHLPPPLQKLLAPLLSQEPAAQLIRSTARQQWRLLAVVFLAEEVLTAPEATRPVLTWWPAAAGWLNALPPTALFISLLALAVLLQALQSLGRFANTVSVGYFAAECRAQVMARIHSQGPEAIRIQIEQSGQLLAVLPAGAALSDWDEPGLASP